MYALIEYKGKQYKAEKGAVLTVDKLSEEKGATVELDADFFGGERAIDEVAASARVHLDLCAHACQARDA